MTTPQRPIPVPVSRTDGEATSDGPARAPEAERAQAPPPIVQTPPIDIFEEPDGLVLLADLPGAPEDGIAIEVESNLLTLRAEARCPVPATASPLLEEFPFGAYRRTFILSDEVDRSRISAELRNGVLRLSLPKAERCRPRRIEIKGLDGDAASP